MSTDHPQIKIKDELFVLLPTKEYMDLLTLAGKLGDLIKSTRIKHGLTAQEFGEIAGLTQAQISRLENGQKAQARTIARVRDAVHKIGSR